MISYNNGEYAFTNEIKISVDNLAYNRSFGVFDFMRMEKKTILFLEDYLKRFNGSQRFLFNKAPYSKQQLKEILSTLIDLNGVEESTFKFILSANIINNQMTPHLVILNAPYNAYSPEFFTKGVGLLEKEYVRDFSEYKTLNYLTSFQYFEEYQKTNSIDVLFHYKNQVSEGSRSNVFMVNNGKIYTSKNDILHGVTRTAIMRDFKNNLKVNVKNIRFDEILKADEVFISSTLKKVMPIVKIGNKTIKDGKVGPITKQAMQRFEEICSDYIKKSMK